MPVTIEAGHFLGDLHKTTHANRQLDIVNEFMYLMDTAPSSAGIIVCSLTLPLEISDEFCLVFDVLSHLSAITVTFQFDQSCCMYANNQAHA